jgi:hypothetical protein
MAQDGATHDLLLDFLEELQRARMLRLFGKQLGDLRFCRVELIAAARSAA